MRIRSIAVLAVAVTLSFNVAAAVPFNPSQQVADPAAAGWSVERLAAARAKAEAIGSAAVMVVDSGRTIAAWGDIERRFRTASLRKSLISVLYGNAVARKQIDLDATLEDLAIDDIQQLTAEEKRTTVRDLLSARSGVYHPAAKVTPGQVRSRPPRGSHAAGTFWFYNNWDFNVAGGLLARATGTDPGELFLREIAKPTGMQDFRAKDFYWEPEPRVTRHPAFDFRISTRDLARLGVLLLNDGRWNGRRVLPESWIKESVRIVTPFGDGSGYGYMWWINPETSSRFGLGLEPGARPSGSYAAEGAGAQILFVLPAKNLVIVHRGDTDLGPEVDETKALALIAEIVRAKTGNGKRRVALRPLQTEPFARALEPLVEYEAIALDESIRSELPGKYVISPQLTVEIFENDGRLFVSAPGRPDVQLHQHQPDRFFARSIQLLVDAERGPGGEIIAIRAVLQGQPMRGVRAASAPDSE
ncbi:MAG: serine hydrolase domain-containing protein [Thermoanaerobaculia bacterium]